MTIYFRRFKQYMDIYSFQIAEQKAEMRRNCKHQSKMSQVNFFLGGVFSMIFACNKTDHFFDRTEVDKSLADLEEPRTSFSEVLIFVSWLARKGS